MKTLLSAKRVETGLSHTVKYMPLPLVLWIFQGTIYLYAGHYFQIRTSLCCGRFSGRSVRLRSREPTTRRG